MKNETIQKQFPLQNQVIQGGDQGEIQPFVPAKIEIGTVPAMIGIVVFLVSVGIAWGTIKTLVKGIKNTLDNNIIPDLKDIRERFGTIEDRVDTLWKDKFAPSRSPRQLNDYGNNILKNSGIKEIVEAKRNQLTKLVKKEDPKNAYDAEKITLSVVADLPKHCPEIIDQLKNGAYKVGTDLDGLLLVGGLHLRNLIFPDLGFFLTDLDKPKSKKPEG